MATNEFSNSNNAFLGRGWGFPVTFAKGGNTAEMLEAESDINSDLLVLMLTAIGERVMRPDYGCNLDELVFETLSTTFATFITEQIRTAILLNEPRVKLDDVEYDPDYLEGRITITVHYTIIATNTRANLVFPYYLNEGTDIKQ
jgi:phage baseplate assembly protein W